jgi:hypothetical protein
MSAHQFVAMWDCNGLEYVGDVTAAEQDRTWSALQSKAPTATIPNLLHLELRARYNTQRHYEIYIFNAQEGIGAEDIREMFDADPQTAADTIRRIGHKFYSDRREEHNIKIR